MKRSALLLLAVSSAATMSQPATAAQRPRYGGTLRVEIQASLTSLEPDHSSGSEGAQGLGNLRALLYDRLVRLDANGQPQAALAISWNHDRTSSHWKFKLRPNVKWHD